LELAIVSPFLAIVMVGMFELTRVMMVKQILDEAARKGCRSGIVPGQGSTFPTPATSTGSSITADVVEVLGDTYNGLDPTKCTITVTVGSSTPTTYSVSGSSGSYTVAQGGGSGADPLTATSGTQISVKVSMSAGSFIWAGTKFVSGTTIESENVTMAKQ
jgi:Flp pilus assembly protein TadG